jgi:hypothetical protein
MGVPQRFNEWVDGESLMFSTLAHAICSEEVVRSSFSWSRALFNVETMNTSSNRKGVVGCPLRFLHDLTFLVALHHYRRTDF